MRAHPRRFGVDILPARKIPLPPGAEQSEAWPWTGKVEDSRNGSCNHNNSPVVRLALQVSIESCVTLTALLSFLDTKRPSIQLQAIGKNEAHLLMRQSLLDLVSAQLSQVEGLSACPCEQASERLTDRPTPASCVQRPTTIDRSINQSITQFTQPYATVRLCVSTEKHTSTRTYGVFLFLWDDTIRRLFVADLMLRASMSIKHRAVADVAAEHPMKTCGAVCWFDSDGGAIETEKKRRKKRADKRRAKKRQDLIEAPLGSVTTA